MGKVKFEGVQTHPLTSFIRIFNYAAMPEMLRRSGEKEKFYDLHLQASRLCQEYKFTRGDNCHCAGRGSCPFDAEAQIDRKNGHSIEV